MLEQVISPVVMADLGVQWLWISWFMRHAGGEEVNITLV
jgi:hypothetical protein